MVVEEPVLLTLALLTLAVGIWAVGELIWARCHPTPVPRPRWLGQAAGRVSAIEFPYGLMCGECGEWIEDGDDYWTTPDGMDGDTPVEVIVCVNCAIEVVR